MRSKRMIDPDTLGHIEVTCSNGKKYLLLPYEHLADVPMVDAAEVVPCEKCMYFHDGACANIKNQVAIKVPDFGEHYVFVSWLRVAKEHFCRYGKRGMDHGE